MIKIEESHLFAIEEILSSDWHFKGRLDKTDPAIQFYESMTEGICIITETGTNSCSAEFLSFYERDDHELSWWISLACKPIPGCTALCEKVESLFPIPEYAEVEKHNFLYSRLRRMQIDLIDRVMKTKQPVDVFENDMWGKIVQAETQSFESMTSFRCGCGLTPICQSPDDRYSELSKEVEKKHFVFCSLAEKLHSEDINNKNSTLWRKYQKALRDWDSAGKWLKHHVEVHGVPD